MIKKVKLSDYLASAPIQENLKTFTGIDANNALGLMTPERLAAVAGELINKTELITTGDVNDYKQTGKFQCYGSVSNSAFPRGNILYVERVLEYIHQVSVDVSTGEIRSRTYIDRPSTQFQWTEWKVVV